jgi:hypothetical protein
MSTAESDTPQHDSESEIWSAISAFETILEAIPDDRSSLETLSHAYDHIGDQTKTLEYLLRLGQVIVRDGDSESAGYISEKLKHFGSADADLLAVCEQLDALQATVPVVEDSTAVTDTHAGISSRDAAATSTPGFRVADELSFAWKLFKAGELTQEEYAGVAQDLTEMSADDHLSTISVLHTLEQRAFNGLDRLMGFVSRDTRTPIISLLSFELQGPATSLLPVDFMIRRGVIVYGLLADDALVVVMNPDDSGVRLDIESRIGKQCHFFMALPSEFDVAISSIKDSAPSES